MLGAVGVAAAIFEQFQAYTTCHFQVLVDGIPMAAFTECTLPSLEVETGEEIKEGGLYNYTHKLPLRIKNGTVTLKHGLIRGNVLMTWYLAMLKGDFKNAKREVAVVVLEQNLIPVMILAFRDAMPTKWSGPKLNSGENAVAVEELTFVYTEIIVV
jgi:phage tail-like protein